MAEWPVLEDEWVLAVIERGMRLPPDVLVALLAGTAPTPPGWPAPRSPPDPWRGG